MKRKILGIVLLTVCAILILCLYVFVLRKPRFTTTDVSVTGLRKIYENSLSFYSDEELFNIIPEILSESVRYPEYQNLWGDDELPSKDPRDYARLTFKFSAKNTTILDYQYKYSLISDYDQDVKMAVVNFPSVTGNEIKRLDNTCDLECSLYIYIGNKTPDEIKRFAESIRIQMCYDNKIYHGSSSIIKPRFSEIEFVK